MRLLPRRAAAEPVDDGTRDDVVVATSSAPKGRPTPKRRDADPPRGPVTAPKTRKEAMQRQRQQVKQSAKASKSGAPVTPRDRRQRMLSGDPNALPRRDAGPLKALARDYVDSRRMLSNGLLLLFPLIFLSFFVRTPLINIVILALFLLVLVEWLNVGRKILILAKARGIDVGKTTALNIGFYGGTRAYLPARMRMPRPRVRIREQI